MILEWNDGGGALMLQSTTDLQSGTWQDVVGAPMRLRNGFRNDAVPEAGAPMRNFT